MLYSFFVRGLVTLNIQHSEKFRPRGLDHKICLNLKANIITLHYIALESL